MTCPKCNKPGTRVTANENHKKIPKIWRRRECEWCLHKFSTIEKLKEK